MYICSNFIGHSYDSFELCNSKHFTIINAHYTNGVGDFRRDHSTLLFQILKCSYIVICASLERKEQTEITKSTVQKQTWYLNVAKKINCMHQLLPQ
jgi:hypothetical protein